MPMDIQETQVQFGDTTLSFEEIAGLAARYEKIVPKTRKREGEGSGIVSGCVSHRGAEPLHPQGLCMGWLHGHRRTSTTQ